MIVWTLNAFLVLRFAMKNVKLQCYIQFNIDTIDLYHQIRSFTFRTFFIYCSDLIFSHV